MPTLRRFPDVIKVLSDALIAAGLVGADRAGGQTPTNLQDVLPFVRVVRVGGGSDLVSDSATVDLDLFHSTYVSGELLAERIRQHLVGPPPPAVTLDRIECTTAPQELPWDGDGGVRRFGATYLVVSRRSVVVSV